MRSFKEQNKIGWNESKYKKTLNETELNIYKTLDRFTKDTLVIEYLKGNNFNLLDEESMEEVEELTYQANKEEIDRKREKEEKKANKLNETDDDRLVKFFNTQGIDNPTKTTLDAFKKQRIQANFDTFYHSMGMFTFNMEKQAKYNYYMSQQKQNFIQIAQNDKLIKQNDEIIDLLKQIANKGV